MWNDVVVCKWRSSTKGASDAIQVLLGVLRPVWGAQWSGSRVGVDLMDGGVKFSFRLKGEALSVDEGAAVRSGPGGSLTYEGSRHLVSSAESTALDVL